MADPAKHAQKLLGQRKCYHRAKGAAA
jgi:hypothetical protein